MAFISPSGKAICFPCSDFIDELEFAIDNILPNGFASLLYAAIDIHNGYNIYRGYVVDKEQIFMLMIRYPRCKICRITAGCLLEAYRIQNNPSRFL